MSVDPSWRFFFEGMEFGTGAAAVLGRESSDLRMYYLITAYRSFGHLLARCNPIARTEPSFPDELKLENFGLTTSDLQSSFPTCGFISKETAPLQELLSAVENIYCRSIGIEYMGLGLVEMEKWIQARIEPIFPPPMTAEEKLTILHQLNQAEGFETFLHTKYVGQKRFSLEGSETIIPMLHAILQRGAEEGISDLILGMAHRGRLNVLTNILGKSYEYIFAEFEDHYSADLNEGTGDVKYHKGFAATYTAKSGKKIQIVLVASSKSP